MEIMAIIIEVCAFNKSIGLRKCYRQFFASLLPEKMLKVVNGLCKVYIPPLL